MVTIRRARPVISQLIPEGASRAEDRPSAALVSRRKRAFDVLLSSALLLVSAPLWAVIALAIKATSPGPVLFRQERAGVDGRTFVLFKFRTMQHGVPDDVHRRFVTDMIITGVASSAVASYEGAFKLSRDTRVTRVGAWLRRTSLDELPQLLNVLAGDMSLIGPRPPIPYEVERYEPWQLERLSVRPGITGLWQVSGRNRLSYVDMIRLDIAYAREWTFRRDLVIALKTPWTMFIDRGGAS